MTLVLFLKLFFLLRAHFQTHFLFIQQFVHRHAQEEERKLSGLLAGKFGKRERERDRFLGNRPDLVFAAGQSMCTRAPYAHPTPTRKDLGTF